MAALENQKSNPIKSDSKLKSQKVLKFKNIKKKNEKASQKVTPESYQLQTQTTGLPRPLQQAQDPGNDVKKERSKTSFFPRIFRVITERKVLYAVISLIFVTTLFIIGLDIYKTKVAIRQLTQQRNDINEQIKHWQNISYKFPEYRDGYLHLAILEYQLGNMKKSKEAIDKALLIDPNFQLAQKLKTILAQSE